MPKERKWRHDDPIPNTECPKCGSPITYNGNYFCTRFDHRTCDWALPEEEYATPKEKHLFNTAYVTLMTQRGDAANSSALWLKIDGTPW